MRESDIKLVSMVEAICDERNLLEAKVKGLEAALKTAIVNFKVIDKESYYWTVSEVLEICEKALSNREDDDEHS